MVVTSLLALSRMPEHQIELVLRFIKSIHNSVYKTWRQTCYIYLEKSYNCHFYCIS
jgi:hypothetical protein